MTRITNLRGDHQPGWLFKSPVAWGGCILWRPHYRPHSMFVLLLLLYYYYYGTTIIWHNRRDWRTDEVAAAQL